MTYEVDQAWIDRQVSICKERGVDGAWKHYDNISGSYQNDRSRGTLEGTEAEIMANSFRHLYHELLSLYPNSN